MSILKCKVCGFEFKPIRSLHFITCDAHDEQELYDAYDCPSCGSQYIAQSRKRLFETPAVEKKDHQYSIGDQISVGKYTATCQKVTDDGAIFMLDQYLDKPYRMNPNDTNAGGYGESALRVELNEDFGNDSNFDSIRDKLLPVYDADLVRIPTVGEFFGPDDFYEMDDAEQWELMKTRKNRIADREGEDYEWGWLQNKVKNSSDNFADVCRGGLARYRLATYSLGVRPVFMLVE